MDDLARGWAIVWAHMHGHLAIWIAIVLPIACGWFAIWMALREKKNADPDEGRLTPKRNPPLPRSHVPLPRSHAPLPRSQEGKEFRP